MNPQLAVAVLMQHLAETTAERDEARAELAKLKAEQKPAERSGLLRRKASK